MQELRGPNGGILIIRYAADGSFSGDDWYNTQDEAEEMAAREFGSDLGPWQTAETDDLDAAILFALALARNSN